MLKQYHLKDYHFRLVIYVLALTILGIMVIGSAKSSVQKTQILGMLLGLTIMTIVSLMDYSFILRFSWLFHFLDLLFLSSSFTSVNANDLANSELYFR